MFFWMFVAYVVIAIIVGYRNKDEAYGSDAYWLGAAWPLLFLLYVVLFFVDKAGFRIR